MEAEGITSFDLIKEGFLQQEEFRAVDFNNSALQAEKIHPGRGYDQQTVTELGGQYDISFIDPKAAETAVALGGERREDLDVFLLPNGEVRRGSQDELDALAADNPIGKRIYSVVVDEETIEPFRESLEARNELRAQIEQAGGHEGLLSGYSPELDAADAIVLSDGVRTLEGNQNIIPLQTETIAGITLANGVQLPDRIEETPLDLETRTQIADEIRAVLADRSGELGLSEEQIANVRANDFNGITVPDEVMKALAVSKQQELSQHQESDRAAGIEDIPDEVLDQAKEAVQQHDITGGEQCEEAGVPFATGEPCQSKEIQR
jgi:hypothetical protein